MTTYNFAVLNPREANDHIFGAYTVGIEVTIPAFASKCNINIDPQHTGGNAERAAIEEALSMALPPAGAILATVRPDLDSFGSMAVLEMRAEGVTFSAETLERIGLIAQSDKFSRGGWPGVRPLPTPEALYDDSTSSAEENSHLAAIAAAICDWKVPTADRVTAMKKWLIDGQDPESYRQAWIDARVALAKAISDGSISAKTADGKIAAVVSSHRAATAVGYCLAPVVVALNPAFVFQGGQPHSKFTVCQFTGGYLNLKAALDELNQLEQGWGGSPTIGGSPQGVSSTLTIEEVVNVVNKHLLN